jgi:hypothetical protein
VSTLYDFSRLDRRTIPLKIHLDMVFNARLSASTYQNARARPSYFLELARTHPRRRHLTKDDLAVGPGVP